MAIVTTSYSVPRQVKVGREYVYDAGSAQYLDGAQMRYAVHRKIRRAKGDTSIPSETIAYFANEDDAKMFVDACYRMAIWM